MQAKCMMLLELRQLPADHGAERNPLSAEAIGNETDCRTQDPDLAQIVLRSRSNFIEYASNFSLRVELLFDAQDRGVRGIVD